MRGPVLWWLSKGSLLPAVEFQIWHMVDIVAGRFGERPAPRRKPPLLETVAVELKLHDVSTVIYQATCNKEQTDRSYCAMPSERCEIMRPDTIEKFLSSGVGETLGRGPFVQMMTTQ